MIHEYSHSTIKISYPLSSFLPLFLSSSSSPTTSAAAAAATVPDKRSHSTGVKYEMRITEDKEIWFRREIERIGEEEEDWETYSEWAE